MTSTQVAPNGAVPRHQPSFVALADTRIQPGRHARTAATSAAAAAARGWARLRRYVPITAGLSAFAAAGYAAGLIPGLVVTGLGCFALDWYAKQPAGGGG